MKDRLNFYRPNERPWPNPRLDRASIIGHTTPTTVRLWFRVSSAGNYCLVIAKNPIPTHGVPMIQEPERTSDRSQKFILATASNPEEIPTIKFCYLDFDDRQDLTQVADITDLEPDTRYYYCLFKPNCEQCWELGHKEILSFKTFPARETTELTFGIYSCHMPYEGDKLVNIELWANFYQQLCQTNARFTIGMGDQVYVDGEENLNIWAWLRKVKDREPDYDDMVSWYRDIYRGYWGMESLQRVLRSFPSYMIWDDHDIFDGWGSYTKAELVAQVSNSWQLENPQENLHLAGEMFAAATQVYQEYQNSHNPPGDLNFPQGFKQFNYSFNYGAYAFYVLDMRGNRDFNREELRVLGAEQWKRFESWLSSQYQGNSQILFVVSPVPVVHLNSFIVNNFDIPYLPETDDLRDHWEHESNWQERNHLLELLFDFSQQTKRQVIFLSGDVHVGAVFKLSHPSFPGVQVFQLTSTPISYANLSSFKRKILIEMVKEEGELGDFSGNVPYKFTNLYLCRQNNFGLVHVGETEGGELSVRFDLFSKAKTGDRTVEKQSIKLF